LRAGFRLGLQSPQLPPCRHAASRVRQFLGRHGIAFAAGDGAQLSPMQSPAARASTLSVGVLRG